MKYLKILTLELRTIDALRQRRRRQQKKDSENRYDIIPDVFYLHLLHHVPRARLVSRISFFLLFCTQPSVFLPLNFHPYLFHFTFFFMPPSLRPPVTNPSRY